MNKESLGCAPASARAHTHTPWSRRLGPQSLPCSTSTHRETARERWCLRPARAGVGDLARARAAGRADSARPIRSARYCERARLSVLGLGAGSRRRRRVLHALRLRSAATLRLRNAAPNAAARRSAAAAVLDREPASRRPTARPRQITRTRIASESSLRAAQPPRPRPADLPVLNPAKVLGL